MPVTQSPANANNIASDDAILRSDVRKLGDLLGQSLVRQEGQELLDLVESVRKAVREGGGIELLEKLSVEDSVQLVRAFSTYFHLANVAEQVHRSRVLADARRDGKSWLSQAVDKIIEARSGSSGVGFGAELQTAEDKNRRDIFADVMPEDLLKFGMIPEFIGRLPVLTSVEQLDKPALMQILTEPKNALVKQYQKLFDLDDVELEFTPESLDAIAELALKRGTGARGLRAIMESVLLSVMYDVPSRTDVAKVVIEKACIDDGAAPTLVNRTGDIPKRASRREKSSEEKSA